VVTAVRTSQTESDITADRVGTSARRATDRQHTNTPRLKSTTISGCIASLIIVTVYNRAEVWMYDV